MRRLPLTFRALLVIPLLAVVVDQARATLACAPDGQSCLETAGQGSLGAAGVVVLLLYALALAVGVGRLVARRGTAARWALGATGLAAVCGGQALLAGALGDAGALGGGWPELLAMCAAAGGVIALALRVAPAAVALVRSLQPRAPRLRPLPLLAHAASAPRVLRSGTPLATAAAGRAPPLTVR